MPDIEPNVIAPISYTEEEQTVANLLVQIGKAINFANEVPTAAEVQHSLSLTPNIAGGFVQNVTEFNEATYQYLQDNPSDKRTDEEIIGVIHGVIHNVVPTVSEIDTALALTVHNEQTALNFTTEQVEAIVAAYNQANPLTQRTVEELNLIISGYTDGANVVPTVSEIVTALNLATIVQQEGLTAGDVNTLIEEYLTQNPFTVNVEDVNNIIDAYRVSHKGLPTVAEIDTALDLTNRLVTPKPIFNITTPMIKDLDDVTEAILNKITALNIALPNPPARDIRYVLNKTIPRYAKTWTSATNKDLAVANSKHIQLVEDITRMYVQEGANLVAYSLEGAVIETLAIDSDVFAVTIDAKRIFSLKNGTVKIYDRNSDGAYVEIQTINDSQYTKMSSTLVGDYVLLETGTTTSIFRLDTKVGEFKLVVSNTVIEGDTSYVGVDGLVRLAITDSSITKNLFDTETGWGAEEAITTKTKVADVLSDYTLPTGAVYLYLSLDRSRIFVGYADKTVILYKETPTIYAVEQEISDVSLEGLTTSFDLSRLYFRTPTKIAAHEASEYI